jgi:hypothetical protein
VKNKIIALIVFASVVSLTAASGSGPAVQAGPQPISERTSVVAGWTTPINISNNADQSRAPVIDLDAQGKAYVIWQDWPFFYGGGGPRQTKFNSNRTGQWEQPFLIHDAAYIAIDDVGFPTVAVNPSGSNIFVVCHDGDFSVSLMQVFYREWANGAWGPAFQNLSEAPAPSEYPAIAFSPLDNTFFCLFMVDVNVPFELAMRYRDGATGNWPPSELTNILTGASKYLYLTKHFKFDPSGVAHAVFTTHRDAWYTKNPTPKNPNTWSAAVNLSGETGLNDTDPRIAVDNNRDVYVVWQHMVSGNQEILYRRTINGVWQAAENLSQTSGDSEFPTIAVNPITSEVHVAWQENLGGNIEVFLKSYELQPGTTTKAWSNNVNFTNSSGGSGEPYMSCDANGNVYLVYVDTASSSNSLDIMYAMKQAGPRPPRNVAIDTYLDAGETRKINKLTWEADPENASFTIINYKIYKKVGSGSFTLLASPPTSTLQYEDLDLDPNLHYTYRMTALSDTGRESQPSPTVDDNKNFVLPPVRVTLTSVLDKILFSRRKHVTITFAKNPLNNNDTVSGYEIYRRKAIEDDLQFSLLTTLNAATFTYSYIIPPPDAITQSYAYAIKTKFASGARSGLSTIVTEQ